jgi:TonB-dependent receptor-like protein
VTEIERLPGFGGDVIKSVQALPGVARPAMTNPGAVVIRGSGNYDTRYFLDGIDIPLLFHYGGVKSTYNSLGLQSVDMYPGGFGTAYGNALGGIVELKGRPGRTDRWHWVTDVSLLDASFHVEGPLGKDWSLLLSARRSYVGELANAALKNVDELNMAVVPYYWDTVARLERATGPGDRLFFTAFAAKDRLDMVFPDEKEGSPEVNEATDAIGMDLQFSRYIMGWDKELGNRFSNSLRASYGQSKDTFHIFGYYDFTGSGPVWQLRDNLAWEATPQLTPNIGFDGIYSPYDYEVRVQGYESSILDMDFADLGSYANVEWRPTENLLVIPGYRYDYYKHLDEGKSSLRLTSRWKLNEKHTLTGAIGTYNQSPQPMGQSTDPVYGNPELPPTTARHFTFGDEVTLNDRTSLKIEAYYNTQDDIPAATDSLDLNFVPDAEARMYGLEFMLRAESSERFFGWISYSLSRSERRFQRWPSAGMDGGDMMDSGQNSSWDAEAWVPSTMDQTHHFEALASYNLGGNWSIGARAQYVTGNPKTPLLSYDGDQYLFDSDTGDYLPVNGDYLSERMEPYVRLDLRIDKTFVKKSTVWKAYFDLQNANYFVYNSPEGYTYNYDYSKRDEYGWIFIPAIGIRVEY